MPTDKEMLDWLEQHGLNHLLSLGGTRYARAGYRSPWIRAASMRNAIAAAMRTSGVAPSQAPSTSPNPLEIGEAIHAAAAAIYFNDSSDYERALWTVLRKLAPALAELMETDPGGAFLRARTAGVKACPKGKGICSEVAPDKRCFTCPVPDPSIQALPTSGVLASDELSDKIDAWHNGAGEGKPLHKFLGMTREEYARKVAGASGVEGMDRG